MKSIDLIYAIPVLIVSVTILISMILLRYRKNTETKYEKEMKQLRLSFLQGKLDRKSFLYVKDNLKVEDIFGDETQRLNQMLAEKSIDPETYCRMKKILSMTFNEKIEKINLKYNYLAPDHKTENSGFKSFSN